MAKYIHKFNSQSSYTEYVATRYIKPYVSATRADGVTKLKYNLTDEEVSETIVENYEDELSGFTYTPQEFLYRGAGGSGLSNSVTAGIMKNVNGNTIVWNQIYPPFNAPGLFISDRATINVVSSSEIEVTGTGETTGYYLLIGYHAVTSHKYYVRFDGNIDSGSSNDVVKVGGNYANVIIDGQWHNNASIVTAGNTDRIFIQAAPGYTSRIKNLCVIDLTRMFGDGNEPTTVAEFEALYPLSYYAYNSGTLVNNGAIPLIWNQLISNGNTPKTVFIDNSEAASSNYSDIERPFSTVLTGMNDIIPHKVLIVYDINVGQQQTLTNNNYIFLYQNYSFVGHFYFGGETSRGRNIKYVLGNYKTSEYTREVQNFYLRVDSGCIADFTINSISVYDLTLMFGQGNEPTTVAEFEALYPLSYYPYNSGTTINRSSVIETVGFNQWDEEWDVGHYIYYGTKEPGIAVCSNNYIPILPSTTYFLRSSIDYSFLASFYDINHLSLTTGPGVYVGRNSTFTTPENAHYMMFFLDGRGIPPMNDICINISDPARNGQYERYWKFNKEIPITTMTGKKVVNGSTDGQSSVVICPDGLRSAGSVRDEIVVENGYATKVIKRISSVNLGTLTWASSTANGQPCYYSSDLSSTLRNGGVSSEGDAITNIVCSKYISTYKIYDADSDKCITTYLHVTQGNIIIRDTSIADATALTTALSGVYAYYELITPETYVLDNPIPMAYKVGDGGTERILPGGTQAPFKSDIAYI